MAHHRPGPRRNASIQTLGRPVARTVRDKSHFGGRLAMPAGPPSAAAVASPSSGPAPCGAASHGRRDTHGTGTIRHRLFDTGADVRSGPPPLLQLFSRQPGRFRRTNLGAASVDDQPSRLVGEVPIRPQCPCAPSARVHRDGLCPWCARTVHPSRLVGELARHRLHSVQTRLAARRSGARHCCMSAQCG